MTDSLFLFFKSVPIFAGLSDAAIAHLIGLSEPVSGEPEVILVQEGSPGNAFYLVQSGKVAVVKEDPAGQDVLLATLTKGDFFGEMSIIECMPRSASIRVLEKAELYQIKTGALFKLFKTMPDQYAILILNISRDLCRRLRKMDDVHAARGG